MSKYKDSKAMKTNAWTSTPNSTAAQRILHPIQQIPRMERKLPQIPKKSNKTQTPTLKERKSSVLSPTLNPKTPLVSKKSNNEDNNSNATNMNWPALNASKVSITTSSTLPKILKSSSTTTFQNQSTTSPVPKPLRVMSTPTSMTPTSTTGSTKESKSTLTSVPTSTPGPSSTQAPASKSALPPTSGWATSTIAKRNIQKQQETNRNLNLKSQQPAPKQSSVQHIKTSTLSKNQSKSNNRAKGNRSMHSKTNEKTNQASKAKPALKSETKSQTPTFADLIMNPAKSKGTKTNGKPIAKNVSSVKSKSTKTSLSKPELSIPKKASIEKKNIKHETPNISPSKNRLLSAAFKALPPPPSQLLDPRLDFFHGKTMMNSKNQKVNMNTTTAKKTQLTSNISIVKGKQRVKPRKKKLSTLKKSILQERLRQWKEAHGHDSNKSPEMEQKNDTAHLSSETSANQGKAVGSTKIMNPNSSIVCLLNFVFPKELEDDDEYEEILSDLTDMSTKIGQVSEVYIPRTQLDSSSDQETKESNYPQNEMNSIGLAFVTFQRNEDARAALDCWSNMLLSGNRVQTMLVDSYKIDLKEVEEYHQQMTDPSPSLSLQNDGIQSSEKPNQNPIMVVLDNILTDEDFEDEECLQECRDDIYSLATKFGTVREVKIEHEGSNKGLVFLTYEGKVSIGDNLEVSKNAVNGLDGMQIGGETVRAQIFNDSSKQEKLSVIELSNILTEDDYVDDECFEETKEDLARLLGKYGSIHNMNIERFGPQRGLITVSFDGGYQIADTAVKNLNGVLLGGQKISATLKSESIGAQERIAFQEENATLSSTVVFGNFLNDDDFEDDECFEETKSDIVSMVSKYGKVSSVEIVRSGDQKGLTFVTYSNGNASAVNAVEEMDGKMVGGTMISAKLLKPTSMREEDHEKECNELNEPISSTEKISQHNIEEDCNRKDSIKPMYSGGKIIPQRYAECKLVPKIPNSGIPREYASRIPDESVVTLLIEMLGELMKFQLRSKDDANARARRRLVVGLREVARGIRSHKVKMVVMANNLDTYGALDVKLQEILSLAKTEDVPVLFEFNKRKLGKAIGKSIKVAVVGVQNADGAHEHFKKLKKLCLLPRIPSSGVISQN